jgi:hypothetical protein
MRVHKMLRYGSLCLLSLLAPTTTTAQTDLKSAIQLAYEYGLPVFEMSRIQYAMENNPQLPIHLELNQFYHRRKLSSPKNGPVNQLITATNPDTLYSIALVDLRSGPVRIDVPETSNRYYSIALIDEYTNDFGYIGRRATGTHAGSYLLVGPDEQTTATAQGASKVIRSPTEDVLLLLRILLYDEEDLSEVHRLQDQFKLIPSGVSPTRAMPPKPVPNDASSFIAVVNYAISRDPPPEIDGPALKAIGAVGIGPFAVPLTDSLRQTWDKEFSALRQNLLKTMKARWTEVNGWMYMPADTGRFGTDYETRAQVAAVGLFASAPEEDTGCSGAADDTGAPLDSSHRYRLRLPAKMPVDAFWSLTAYKREPDGETFLADNPLHRWSIGDRTKGLKRNPDGSLDIYIQRDSPGDALKSNWLPLPDGSFQLMLRNYQPKPELLDGNFRYPALERLD